MTQRNLSALPLRNALEEETLRYAAQRLSDLADKYSTGGAANREAAGSGDGFISQSAAVPTPPVVRAALGEIDRAASVAHDFIYGKNEVTQEQASQAIWRIHDIVNSFADADDEVDPGPWRMPGERYEDYRERTRDV